MVKANQRVWDWRLQGIWFAQVLLLVGNSAASQAYPARIFRVSPKTVYASCCNKFTEMFFMSCMRFGQHCSPLRSLFAACPSKMLCAVPTSAHTQIQDTKDDGSSSDARTKRSHTQVSWCALMKDVVVLVGDPKFVRCQPFSPYSAIELSFRSSAHLHLSLRVSSLPVAYGLASGCNHSSRRRSQFFSSSGSLSSHTLGRMDQRTNGLANQDTLCNVFHKATHKTRIIPCSLA
jgi:hypothetical protein